MRLRYFGGPAADAGSFAVRGRGQEALLFRLALDAGTTVGYRALAEDVWPDDPPADPRASLQSLVSRLRRALPDGLIQAVSGGYRLAMTREEVDLTRFQDLVAAARRDDDPAAAAAALDLWTGDPWTPGEGFDWVVRDLWEDRAHAERLARGTPASIPAPAAAAVPAALTVLVGRRDELRLIADQLDHERLVTLIGPGGAGKTTLALETARRRPGSVVVELAPAADGDVWPALAAAVGRGMRVDASSAPATARDRALQALAGRSVLIVLDNCEHVAREAAAVARDLLGTLPAVRLLTTSREPLGLPGEAFVDLGPLPERDAVELFSRRVRAARGTPPDDADARAVDRIVRRLDGLPLALELAAAKTRTLSLAEVDAGLDDRFTLLVSGPRAADPRHQTLRALIDWSWETLTGAERTASMVLAVFPDGLRAADVPAVATVFDADPAAFDLLVDRSLAHRHDGRFRMLETVREYGIDRLRSAGAEPAFRLHQATAVAGLALSYDALLRGPRVREGLAWFDANEENVSAALRTARETDAAAEVGVRLVRGSLWAWLMRERFDELQAGITAFAGPDAPLDSEPAVVVQGVGLLVEAIRTSFAIDEGMPPPARPGFAARAHAVADAAARHPSEFTAALPVVLDAVDRALTAGQPWPRGFTIDDPPRDAPEWTIALVAMIGSAIAQNSGDVDTLGIQSERALRLFEPLGDVWGIAFASQMRAEWLILEGRLAEALTVVDTSTAGLAGLTAVSDQIQQRAQGITVLVRLGRMSEARARLADMTALAHADGSERTLMQAAFAGTVVELAAGDGEAAIARLDAAPAHAGVGPEQLLAWSATMRARAHLLADRVDAARAALLPAVPMAIRGGDQPILAETAMTLAWWLQATGRDADARIALTAAARIRGARVETDPTWAELAHRLGGADTTAPAEMTADAAVAELERLAALVE